MFASKMKTGQFKVKYQGVSYRVDAPDGFAAIVALMDHFGL